MALNDKGLRTVTATITEIFHNEQLRSAAMEKAFNDAANNGCGFMKVEIAPNGLAEVSHIKPEHVALDPTHFVEKD